MSINNKERRKYIRRVKKCLVCSRKDKKRILSDINNSIDELLYDDPQADITQLENVIGSPKEIAEEYLENVSPDFFRRKKRLFNTIKIIGAVVVLLFAVILLLVIRWTEKSSEGCYYEFTLYEEVDGSDAFASSYTIMID